MALHKRYCSIQIVNIQSKNHLFFLDDCPLQPHLHYFRSYRKYFHFFLYVSNKLIIFKKISNRLIYSKYISFYSEYIVNIVVSLSNVSSEIIGISQSSSNFLAAGCFLKWIVFFGLQLLTYLLFFFHMSCPLCDLILSFTCFAFSELYLM